MTEEELLKYYFLIGTEGLKEKFGIEVAGEDSPFTGLSQATAAGINSVADRRRAYWYNLRTGEFDYRTAPEDYSDYISQHPTAQTLYQLYQDHYGDRPAEAALRVLTLSANAVGRGDDSYS